MAIQNINSVTRVQSMAATAARPSNPLGVEWVSGPAQNNGLQVDWKSAAPPASSPPPSLVTSPAPHPGQKPIPFKVEPEHVRIGTPLITQVGNWIADKVGFGSVGGGAALDPTLPMDPGLGGALPGDPLVVDPGMTDPTLLDPTLSPDFSGGAIGGVGGGVSRAFDALKEAANAGFQAAKGALKRNFIFAGITSAISNGISYFTGKATGKQAVSGFVADTGAYTAIGSASTFAGAALGTLIPIPFVGTAIGIAAGMGLGYLYEKFVRKGLVKQVEGVVDGLSGAVGKKALS